MVELIEKKPDRSVRSTLVRLLTVTARMFGMKLAFNLFLRLLALARAKKGRRGSIFNILTMYIDVMDAKDFAMFLGGFSAAYKLVGTLVRRLLPPKYACVTHGVAGLIAGTAIHLDPARKNLFAVYILPRALQGVYNYFKAKIWPEGKDNTVPGTLLFCVMSAQVMYSYVMRPDALAASYHKFIVKSGPIPGFVLEQIRRHNRAENIDSAELVRFCCKMGGGKAKEIAESSLQSGKMLGCWALHPQTDSCITQFATTWWGTFRKRFALYGSLHALATLLARRPALLASPLPTCTHTLVNTIRSDAFLASFCAVYMAFVCTHNKLFLRDHKIQYWLAGIVCAFSVLLEKKQRRDELTLYVLPRGLEAIYSAIRSHGYLPTVPHAEVCVFAASIAVIMHFYETNPKVLSPLLVKTLKPLIV